MAKMKKCACCLRRIFGWLLIVLGGISGVSSAVCALVALFGGMELDSFGERLRFFATALMMTAAFFTILWLGIRLKNSGRRNMAAGRVMNPSLPAKKKMQRATNVKVLGKCEKCGEPLHAFHYYRDNACFTYCEKCGNSNLAAFAAPYRTIELNFDGHQREGFSLTVEVEKWPSLEQCYLRWYEWNETGGSDVKVDLPTNYMREHTVEEFLAEYILKENDVTNCIPFSINEGLLRQIRNRLTESGVLLEKRTAYAGKITVQDALNTFSEEEQQRFENRLYQYTQDTGRAGLSPEIAAANRGLVFVDGRPVAKEVATRLDEMRNAVSSDNAAMISEKKFVPIFIPNLAGYQMKMHTDSGEEHCFTLTGLKAYYPNMSSMCGYGSDEWCFHCKYNGENYILRFCDDSGYGTIWDCALINKENAEQLEKLSVVEWLKLVLKSETKIFHLHPDTIDAAKNIVQATSSRCGPISDNGFYGR